MIDAAGLIAQDLRVQLLLGLAILSLSVLALGMFGKKLSVKGKTCYVAGGSQGLGKDLAILLAEKGASVVVSARTQSKLNDVLKALEGARKSPDQKFSIVAADLGTAKAASDAFDQATTELTRVPEFVFCTAGISTPRLFLDHTSEEFESAFRTNYFTALYTVHAAAKAMVAAKVKGTIVLTSSVLGFMSLVGYSQYSPTKYALRGLADTLRQELAMYGINVKAYFPATIFSPGYEQEQTTKPEITKKIEETDGGLTPRQCAEGMLKGVERDDYYITTDLIGAILRSSTRGAMPSNNFIVDSVLQFIGWIALPVWRMSVDSMVKKWYSKQQK